MPELAILSPYVLLIRSMSIMLIKEEAVSAAFAISFNCLATDENAPDTADPNFSGANAKTSATSIAIKANNIAYSLIACPWL